MIIARLLSLLKGVPNVAWFILAIALGLKTSNSLGKHNAKKAERLKQEVETIKAISKIKEKGTKDVQKSIEARDSVPATPNPDSVPKHLEHLVFGDRGS